MATGQVAPQKLMQLAADGEDTVLVQGTGPGHWSRAQRKNINEHRLIVRLIVYILLLLFLLLLYIAILIYVHLSPSLSLSFSSLTSYKILTYLQISSNISTRQPGQLKAEIDGDIARLSGMNILSRVLLATSHGYRERTHAHTHTESCVFTKPCSWTIPEPI